MNTFIKTSITIINRQIKTKKKFIPCLRDTCYCNLIIDHPEYTTITDKLLKNTLKCKEEFSIFNSSHKFIHKF